MSNDLSRGLFPAREVKLLIVDEAHKAQGEYAYCQVAKELNRSQVREGDISRFFNVNTLGISVKSLIIYLTGVYPLRPVPLKSI